MPGLPDIGSGAGRLIGWKVPETFHPDVTFRGSPGPTLAGHEQFAGYVRWATSTG